MSRTVLPADSPNICVCTAPDTPTVHKSLFDALIAGEIALGGGDVMVVSDVVVVVTVLSVVDSVTIGSVCA